VFLRERIFEPLGMVDTGFTVPAEKLGRFGPAYRVDRSTRNLEVYDGVADSQWASPPPSPDGAAGLVSTGADYAAFARMMLNHGTVGRTRILSQRSVDIMTTDHLTPEQRTGGAMILGPDRGWGFCMAVAKDGRYGWDGGFGSSWFNDPKARFGAILLT